MRSTYWCKHRFRKLKLEGGSRSGDRVLSAILEKYLRQEYRKILSSERIFHLLSRCLRIWRTVELKKYLILTMKRLQSARVLRRVSPRFDLSRLGIATSRGIQNGSGCLTSHHPNQPG
jgi:hypothetical protein